MDQQELNRILYPGIKRYPDTPDNLRRGTPAYKSLNALQRIHRKKYRQVNAKTIDYLRGVKFKEHLKQPLKSISNINELFL